VTECHSLPTEEKGLFYSVVNLGKRPRLMGLFEVHVESERLVGEPYSVPTRKPSFHVRNRCPCDEVRGVAGFLKYGKAISREIICSSSRMNMCHNFLVSPSYENVSKRS
jgi:hypothetical protein